MLAGNALEEEDIPSNQSLFIFLSFKLGGLSLEWLDILLTVIT